MSTDDSAPAASDRAIAARIFSAYMRPRWPSFALSMACALIVAASSAALAQRLKPAIDDMIVGRRPGALVWIPATIVALALVRSLASVGQARLVNRLGNAIVSDVQIGLFRGLIGADLARLRGAHTGEWVASVLYDAGLIREAATNGLVNLTQNALIVAGALAVMAWYDPWLAAAVLLVGPVAGGVMRRYSRRTKRAAQGAMTETSALSSAIMESLDGVKIVKIDNREAYEVARVTEVVTRRQRHLVSGADAKAVAAPVSEALMMIVTAAVLTYFGWRARNGGYTMGKVSAFIAALAMAAQSLRLLANLSTVMGEGFAAARRLFAVMDTQPTIRTEPGAIARIGPPARVAFEAVSFSYGGGRLALDTVSLEVNRGETVALVGPSGGGKSTLLNLIPRFYDVTGGAIRLDGVDIRRIALDELRRQIALVTQEPILFDDTIRANIGYARPGAGEAEIRAAAEAAAAAGFIDDLPDGLDTIVGEAGARLSGGQRQRLAIARAFLKDAPILLLDEATSALDTESEALIQGALDRLMVGRATLVIAHRLSTVRSANRIYVVDGGRIVETGDHASLVRAGGLYARLAEAQDLDRVEGAAAR